MENIVKKSSSDHVTFRIKSEVLDDLKSISREEKLSLNTIVNQIFESHLNWDVHAAEVGWVVMLKVGLVELIKHVDKETVSKIAKETAEAGSKEIALYMRGKYGIAEWISIIKDRAKMSGFKIKEYRNDDKIKLVLYHDMGENWSVFFSTYHETVFYELGVTIKSDYTENSVVLELENVSL